jgi:sugar phosphate isomerase/epimerase
MPQVGLMLYTVREECARDFEGTLRAVAEMDYEGVEVFSLHDHEPQAIAAVTEELGLPVVARHARLEAIEDDLDGLAAEAQALGWNRLVLSFIDPDTVGDPALPGRLADAARAAAARGLAFGFHNHWAEVVPGDAGAPFVDRLDPAIFLEVDLGWVWWAGEDPVALVERHAGRVPLVHVKDFRTRGERTLCPVGDGAVDWGTIVPAAVAAGAEWLLAEQDQSDGPPLDAARRSLAALRAVAA